MELNLDNKTALVTGSSRGIGRGIASSLINEGCNVILNGLHSPSLKLAARSLGIPKNYFVADVLNPKACKNLVNHVISQNNQLDILICNVGSGRSVIPSMETPLDWKKMFDVNLASCTNIVKASERELSKTKGAIVCVSSIAGIEVTGAPIAYSAMKAALNSYVRGISRPLAKIGIRINAVAPGNIIFQGSIWEKKMSKNPSQVKKMLRNEVSLNRLGMPEEVGNLVSFLASPRASFITGSIFVIDGGQLRS